MADFLAKLAGRTLGIEQSPRPVMAPMFAAGPMMASEHISESSSQETLATDSFPSPMPPSTKLEQGGLAIHRERPADLGQEVREPGTHRLSAPATQAPGFRAIVSLREQPAVANEQSAPGSITPRKQTDFSPPQEPHTLVSPHASMREEHPSARSVNSRREPYRASATRPTIKVSIGRIDVRAITSPTPTTDQKASSIRPQPSLEEYLQARNRGRR